MPIPLITTELIAKSKTCDNGWSLLQLEDVRSQAAAKGNGVNTFFDFEAISGPGNSDDNAGRRITYLVSGAGLEAGVADVINIYIQLLCALTNSTAAEIQGQEIDEKNLIGLKVWADIGERAVEGKLYKDFKCFSPADATPF